MTGINRNYPNQRKNQCWDIFSETPPKNSSNWPNIFLKMGIIDPIALIALGPRG